MTCIHSLVWQSVGALWNSVFFFTQIWVKFGQTQPTLTQQFAMSILYPYFGWCNPAFFGVWCQLFDYHHCLKYLLFCSTEKKNSLNVSKWWQNLHFLVHHPIHLNKRVRKCYFCLHCSSLYLSESTKTKGDDFTAAPNYIIPLTNAWCTV